MLVATLVGLCGALVGAAVLEGAYDLGIWWRDRTATDCLWLALLAGCQALALVMGAVVLARPPDALYNVALGARGLLLGLTAILAMVVVGQLVPGVAIRVPVAVTAAVLAVRMALFIGTDLVMRHPVVRAHWPTYGPASAIGIVFALAVFWVALRTRGHAGSAVRWLLTAAVAATLLVTTAAYLTGPGRTFEVLATFQLVPSVAAVLGFGALRIARESRERERLAAREVVIADLVKLSIAHSDPQLVRGEAERALARVEGFDATIDLLGGGQPEVDLEALDEMDDGAVVVHGREATVVARHLPAVDSRTEAFVRAALQVIAASADRAALAADAAFSATHDDVTGLPNRLLVLDRIAAQLADPARGRTALVLCGLTRYEEHLAVAGVDGADRLARRVAAALAPPASSADALGRIAPTIFAVVCRLDEDDLTGALTRRVQDLGIRLRAGLGTTTPVGSALGAAVAGPGAASASDLLRDAMAALRRSSAGSGAPEVFDAELGVRLRERAEFEQALVGAVDRDEIVVHYQPIVDAGTRKVTAYEALARWRRRSGLVPPNEWVPVAESLGLIGAIGERVLRIAVRDQPMLGAKVTVNVAPQQLASDAFVDRVLALIATTEPGALLLEITETAVMADVDRARRTLSRLREHGVLISLDDFGTSYSSLGALATLPIDGIKIDRVFVDGLAGAKGLDVVAAIVGLARTLDKVTVIEGVETEDQFATLAAIGVDRIQGYLVGRPGPVEDFAVR